MNYSRPSSVRPSASNSPSDVSSSATHATHALGQCSRKCEVAVMRPPLDGRHGRNHRPSYSHLMTRSGLQAAKPAARNWSRVSTAVFGSRQGVTPRLAMLRRSVSVEFCDCDALSPVQGIVRFHPALVLERTRISRDVEIGQRRCPLTAESQLFVPLKSTTYVPVGA